MKKIISLIFALSVLFVFADASNDFSGQPFSVCAADEPSSSIISNGYKVYDQYTSQDHSTLSLSMYAMSTVENTYCFSVGTSLYACSKFSGGKIRMAYSSNSSPTTYNISIFDSDSGYYYISIGSNSGANYLVFNAPSFESLSDGFSYIDNLAVVVDSSFSLPAGNVAYIKYSGSNVVLSCHQPIQSAFASSSPWPNTNQYYGFSSYLPSSSTVFPLSVQNIIPWQRSGKPSILGQYYDSSLNLSGSTSQYLVIYNPYFTDLGNINSDPPNGDIVITVSSATQIIVYPILGSYSGGSLIGMSEDDWSSSYSGVIDSETGDVTFFNNDGDPSEPTIGGSNFSPEDITATGFLNKIVSVLEGIVKSLTSIFGFAYEAIISLVGLASNFVVVLGGLYSWLPSPLYTVLISAITLAITIGVFKVFL